MTGEELALRARILTTFARTGAPPDVPAADAPALRSLAEQHVVVLDEDDRIAMAHPFAAPPGGATRAESGGRTWFGNCAWDALGIAAALGLRDATITDRDLTVRVRDGVPLDDAVFFVRVPARDWWADIWFT